MQVGHNPPGGFYDPLSGILVTIREILPSSQPVWDMSLVWEEKSWQMRSKEKGTGFCPGAALGGHRPGSGEAQSSLLVQVLLAEAGSPENWSSESIHSNFLPSTRM